jgi:hypothetical protein
MEADEAAADAGIKKDGRREPLSGKWILGVEQGFRRARRESGARNAECGFFKQSFGGYHGARSDTSTAFPLLLPLAGENPLKLQQLLA